MIDIGRICVKTAGKDAGKPVVVVEQVDNSFVIIDGQVKRKRCNIKHLEPTTKTITLKTKSTHADVVKAFKQLNIDITEPKTKTKKTEKPKRQKKTKEQQAPENNKQKTAKKTKPAKTKKK